MRLRRIPLLAALPVAGYLALLVLVAALYVKPPLIGWIGFAVVGAIGTAVAAGAALLFPRMRTNVATAAATPDGDVLVLADGHCSTAQLCDNLASRLRGRETDVRVVAPVLASPLHYLSGDMQAERAEAQRRLDDTLEELHRVGIDATGSVGTDDPLQALADALTIHAARELVIVTSGGSHWLERDLVADARRLVPQVEQLVVETAALRV